MIVPVNKLATAIRRLQAASVPVMSTVAADRVPVYLRATPPDRGSVILHSPQNGSTIIESVKVDCQEEESYLLGSDELLSVLKKAKVSKTGLATIVREDETERVTVLCEGMELAVLRLWEQDGDPIEEFLNLRNYESTVLPWNTFEFVAHTMCKDEMRKNLNGMQFKVENGNQTLVSTDGKRMSVDYYFSDSDQDFEMLIPRSTVDTFVKVGKRAKEIEFRFSDDRLWIQAGTLQALIWDVDEHTFPNYDMIVPKNNRLVFDVDREALITALNKVVMTFEGDKEPVAVFCLVPGDEGMGKLIIKSETECSTEVVVSGAIPEGEEPMGFRVAYLLEALKRFPGTVVTLRTNGAKNPLLIEDDGSRRNVWKEVVMPVLF